MLGLSERSARFFSSVNKKFCKISHIRTWGKTYETSPKLHMRALVFPLRGLYSTPIFSNKINTFVPLDRISIFGKTSTPYIQMLARRQNSARKTQINQERAVLSRQ